MQVVFICMPNLLFLFISVKNVDSDSLWEISVFEEYCMQATSFWGSVQVKAEDVCLVRVGG